MLRGLSTRSRASGGVDREIEDVDARRNWRGRRAFQAFSKASTGVVAEGHAARHLVLDQDGGLPAGEDRGQLAGQALAEVHVADVDVAQALGPFLEDRHRGHVGPGGAFLDVERGRIAGVLAVAHGEAFEEGLLAERQDLGEILLDLGEILLPRADLSGLSALMDRSFRGG